jgi:hypothetical protein
VSAHYKRHPFPAEIIAHAVWLYYRLPLSLRDVDHPRSPASHAYTGITSQRLALGGAMLHVKAQARRSLLNDLLEFADLIALKRDILGLPVTESLLRYPHLSDQFRNRQTELGLRQNRNDLFNRKPLRLHGKLSFQPRGKSAGLKAGPLSPVTSPDQSPQVVKLTTPRARLLRRDVVR